MRGELLSANHAAAMAATLAGRANRTGRGFCSGVYPITPSTECMEFLCGQQIEKGKVVRVESEHSAMGVCIGAAAAGARTFTATASNGLAYMAENCVAAAGLRLPIVLAIANRTMGPPWNIWADHGDALMLRDLGLVQIYCADNQELFDTVLSAFRLAEDQRVLMPAMVCMEGFILSHTVAQTLIPTQEQVDRFLPLTRIPQQLGEVPHSLGQIELPAQTEAHRMQHHQALLGSEQVLEEMRSDFAAIFGRELQGALVPYRTEDADTLIVSLGTMGLTAQRLVDRARERGRKVGSLRVRMLRPLPVEAIAREFAGKGRIAVLDRDISLGFGGVLWGEVARLAAPGTVVQNYLAGIGGGDVRPEHLEKVLADLTGRQRPDSPVFLEAL
jgi:pyruvate/2-oxoacid:ferredoxin oxidoreductase alpha subunit